MKPPSKTAKLREAFETQILHETFNLWSIYLLVEMSGIEPLTPPACKAGALPTELHPPRISPEAHAKMVGLTGVEPVTSPLSGARSNQLSYRPNQLPKGYSLKTQKF